MCGDLNYSEIDWDSWSTTDTQHSTDFLEAIRDSFLYQHVREPTRARGTDRPSLLDLVLTNEEHMVNNIQYGAPLGKSDHAVLTFNIDCYATDTTSQSQARFLYHKGDYGAMRRELDIDWEETFGEHQDDPSHMYDTFTTKLLDLQQKYIPTYKHKPAHKRKTHISPTTREAIREKRRKWRAYTSNPTEDNKTAYCRARNKLRKLIRKDKRDFEANLAENVKTNPKQFWRYARSKMKTRATISELVTETRDGTKTTASTNYEKA